MKVADMHCDTIGELMKGKLQGTLRKNKLHVDIDKLTKSDYLLQNFAMFVNMREYPDCYSRCKEMIAYWKKLERKYDMYISAVSCIANIEENIRRGRISALLTVEEGECCEGDVLKLEEFYKLGIRMMTITWNYENSLGYPATPRCKNTGKKLAVDMTKGLTKKGKDIVFYMQNIGMLADVSHLSDKGFYDVYDIAKSTGKPFVASHSNARSIAGHARNLTDEMIKAVGECGGIIGINFYPPFLSDKKNSAEELLLYTISHIRHMINKGGIGCVGLGTDFDGIDGKLAISDASKMQILYEALKKAGFAEGDIEHIFWKNVINVYKEVFF
ncbi:MAG: membrane dipeptidase [Lachnospiraceae bacterium]|nr:membrane dipeptidase [Lachnospiraceae bacterium]